MYYIYLLICCFIYYNHIILLIIIKIILHHNDCFNAEMWKCYFSFYCPLRWLRFGPFTFPQIAVLRCYPCAEKCAVEVLDPAQPQTFLRFSRGQTKHKGLLFWRSHSFDILLICMYSQIHLCSASSTHVTFKEEQSII